MASASNSESKDENYEVLTAHFGSMWYHNIHPDIKLKTSLKEYPAHKCVLSARSPVFANKLSSHDGEFLDILDLDDDVITYMLRYIYAGFVGGFHWKSALGIYTVAAYYELLTLKNICSAYLKKHLTLDDAPLLRTVASVYDDDDLKGFAKNFISKHEPSLRNRLRNLVSRTSSSAGSDPEPSSDAGASNLNEEQSLAVKNTLINDFKTMIDRSIYSDIKLRTRGGEYPAHKCVLMARSPEFKTLLSNDSSETFDMGDMDSAIVCRMLLYFYTGQVEELGMASAVGLYVAAGKYRFGLPLVKKLCLSYITEHLGSSNAHDALQMLKIHPDEDLENFIFALIRANIKDYKPETLTVLFHDVLLSVLNQEGSDSGSDSDSDSDSD